MAALRLWRLRRGYRAIAKAEASLADAPLEAREEAQQLRLMFASQTLARADRTWKALGAKRHERRRAKRQLVA